MDRAVQDVLVLDCRHVAHNKALMIMPGAFTEPDMAEKVRAAVKISNLANVRVRGWIGSG